MLAATVRTLLRLQLLTAAFAVPEATAEIRRLPLEVTDLVYDGSRGRIYASVPGTVRDVGNTIVTIDPRRAALDDAVSPVFIGSDPRTLALDDADSVLYVALHGAAKVARMQLDTLEPDLTFGLGTGSYSGAFVPDDIAVMPGHPETVAVSLTNTCCSPSHEGVAIYDDGVRRPVKTPGHTGANRIEFGTDPNLLFGYNFESTEFGFRRLGVNATGVRVLDVSQGLIDGFYVDILFHDGVLYATSGAALLPEVPTLVGTFPLGDYPASSVAADATLDRVYFLKDDSFDSDVVHILAFEQSTFRIADDVAVPGAETMTTGALVRWGETGLAFRAANGVFFVGDEFAPCTGDADCDDGDDCTGDTCNAGSCEHQALECAQECFDHFQCDDGDACTTDTCTAGVCEHEPTVVPECRPTCDEALAAAGKPGTCWTMAGTSVLHATASGTLQGQDVTCSTKCQTSSDQLMVVHDDGTYFAAGGALSCSDGRTILTPDERGRWTERRGKLAFEADNSSEIASAILACSGSIVKRSTLWVRVSDDGTRLTGKSVVRSRAPGRLPIRVQAVTHINGTSTSDPVTAPERKRPRRTCVQPMTLRCRAT